MDSLSAIEGEYTSIAASQGRALADTDFALSRVAAVEAENAMLRDELARLSMTTAAVKTDSEAIALADTIPGIEPVTVAVAESVPATE